MAKGDTFNHLVDEIAEALGVDAYGVLLKDFKKILFHVLKDEIQTALPR